MTESVDADHQQDLPRDGVQSAVMALEILEFLANRREPIGVSALAREFKTSKSRIFRYLRTLVHMGYIVQMADNDKYKVGSRLAMLGRKVAENYDLSGIARPIMQELRDRLGHTVILSQLNAENLTAIAAVSGKSIYETGVKIGGTLGFHHTAQGKVTLAFGPDFIRERVLKQELFAATPETITSPERLISEAAVIREQGWAAAPNEALIGINALAAPIYGDTDTLVGALAIIDSIQFIEAKPSDEQISAVCNAARQISLGLGASPHVLR